MNHILLVLLGFFLSLPATAVIPGDVDYFIHSSSERDIVLPKEYFHLVNPVGQYSLGLDSFYKKSFNWELDEKPTFILTSSKNQVANATSTMLPFSTNTLYGGGAYLLDTFATKSWLKTLLSHETAHLYQMNPKQGLSKWTKKLFGNHLFFVYPIIPIPVFVHPNYFLPTWIVEGNAVFNEALFGNGGRPFSGEERALFYSLVSSGELDETRLTNNHLEFPYQREKYTVGGFFNLYLAKKYGTHKVNSFFLKNSEHYFNPLLLNSTFEEHFGKSYKDSIADFLKFWGRHSKRQKVDGGPTLTLSVDHTPFNSDHQKIYFLTNPDGRREYVLNIFDKTTRQLEQKSIDLPPGKLFEIERGKFVSAASDYLRRREIVYGLWGTQKTFYPHFHSKIVLDMKGPNTLYFDAKTSFDEAHLFLNDKSLGPVNSGALFGPKGEVYYFKQVGKGRILFRNEERLFSLHGYYAKLADIGEEGEVYFVGNTKAGSSLFQYKEGNISRLSSSDVIIDAKKIRNNQFLICEINAKNYQYKIMTADVLPGPPHAYDYFFELAGQVPSPEEARAAPARDAHPYNSLHELRFQSWSWLSYFGETSESLITANFADPLQQNDLVVEVDLDHTHDEKIARAIYTNNRHVTAWTLMMKGILEKRFPPLADPESPELRFGLSHPIFDFGHWKSNIIGQVAYEFSPATSFVHYLAADIGQTKLFPLSFSPFRHLNLRGESIWKTKGEKTGLSWRALYDLGGENILAHETVLGRSTTGELMIGSALDEKINLFPIKKNHYYADGTLTGARIGLGYKKVLNQGIYFKAFPIALRRLAPETAVNYFTYSGGNLSPYTEASLGLSTELLLAHIFPLKMNLGAIKRFPEKDVVYYLNFNSL